MELNGNVACQMLPEHKMIPQSSTLTDPISKCDEDIYGLDGNDDSERYEDSRTGDDEDESQDGLRQGEKRDSDDQSSSWSKSKKRRKQSNPIKYRSVSPLDLARVKPKSEQVESAVESSDESHHTPPVDSSCDNKIKCPHCGELFVSEDLLKVHIEEEHVQKLLEKQLQQHQQYNLKSSTSLSNGVTNQDNGRENNGSGEGDRSEMKKGADSPCMSTPFELSMASQAAAFAAAMSNPVTTSSSMGFPPIPGLIPSITHNGSIDMPVNLSMSMGAFPGHVPPYLIPLFPQGQSSPVTSCPTSSTVSTSYTPSGIRIFNPEAYCELCNKEFCNKYFLKTHKANKHGIYSMESFVNLPYGNALFAASLAASALPAQLRPILGASPPAPDSSMMMKPCGIMNMESYCEICQKEFCNKYFLKKHKFKIHGIADLSPPNVTSSGPSATSISSHIATTASLSSNKTTVSASPIKVETSQVTSQTVTPIVSSSVDQKPVITSHATIPQDIPLKVNHESEPVESASPPKRAPVSPGKQLPCLSPINTSFDSKKSMLFTPEKLREIGVINADAFCEICCKEFCNKYFLRTHKQNKHGMSIPDTSPGNSSSSTSTVGTGGNVNISPTKSNNPASCGSESTNAYEGLSVLSKIVSTPSQSSLLNVEKRELGEIHRELSCTLCSRPFASPYLLKMHMFYTHNVSFPGDEHNEKATDSSHTESTSKPATPTKKEDNQTTVYGVKQHSTTDASQNLHKLQNLIQELNGAGRNSEYKVQCHMCFQEMDNKYFLRAHMMTEHGTLLSEENTNLTTAVTCQSKPDVPIKAESPKNEDSLIKSLITTTESDAQCDVCMKDFYSKYFLKQHKITAHGLKEDLELMVENVKTEGCDLTTEPKSVCSAGEILAKPETSVSRRNYCEICNKELCNKYFMKTHMMKMHGIQVTDRNMAGILLEGAGKSRIGGVTCDICQKELCSKYFLKVHKQNTHGVYEEGTSASSSSSSGKENVAQFPLTPPAASQVPGSPPPGSWAPGMDSSRQFNHYSEICPLCDRRFKSIKWLKTHMANDHRDLMKENMLLNNLANMSSPLEPQAMDMSSRSAATVADLIQGQLMNGSGVCMDEEADIISEKMTVPQKQGFESSEDMDEELIPESRSPSSPQSRTSDGEQVPEDGELRKHSIASDGSRVYHCSFCIYTTRWLSNLYAHEKRHSGGLLVDGNEKKYVCKICHRAYRYNHSLQRHLLSHRILGGLGGFQSFAESAENQLDKDEEERNNGSKMKIKKYRCSRCSKKFKSRELCILHIRSFHSKTVKEPGELDAEQLSEITNSLEGNENQAVGPPMTYKCQMCNFVARHHLLLKEHIKEEHKNEHVDIDGMLNAMNPPNQMPMTYAMPQNLPASGPFIMQPFLIAQPETDSKNDDEEGATNEGHKVKTEDEESKKIKSKPFVPSLVYLPVSQKISEPLTVAFTLTPA